VSSPPRHQCKFRIRNSEFGIPTQPPFSQRRGAETQRHRESCRRLHRTARSWPSDGGIHRLTSAGEIPWSPSGGHETTGSGNRVESELSCRFPDPVACALEKRRTRLFSFLFNSWEKYTSLPIREEVRQNRRANDTSAGEKTGRNGCLYPKRWGFSPATGDRPIACRSAVNPRHHHPNSATTSLRFYGMGGWIWVYLCDLWANLGGSGFAAGRLRRDKREALRLCGSAPLRSFWCSLLVSWCLGGSKFLVSLA
jgi:hypothetical protein